MLTELHIENIAVIKKADIEFTEGLNVLTGETGAGKSIIIDSLNAIMGGRVSRDLVRTGCEKANVTAVFSPSKSALLWLEQNEMDADDELIITRRISGDGKSSARINGAPATASQLRELSASVIDIHGQNDGRQLLDEANHLGFLDTFGDYNKAMSKYAESYKKWRETQKEFNSISMDDAEKERQIENLKFTIHELSEADISEGEFEELSSRRELLKNSEKLTSALSSALELLSDGEQNVASTCSEALHFVNRAASISREISPAGDSLNSAVLSIENAVETVRDFLNMLSFSQEEYDLLEERLHTIRKLQKKYNKDADEFSDYLKDCEQKLDSLEFSSDKLIILQKQLDSDKIALLEVGEKLTHARKKSAVLLQKRIESELNELSMPSAKFIVEISKTTNKNGFDKTGCDEVRFLMTANKGMAAGRISNIASGGELSRIMLAIKNVFAETEAVGTMVFDEVDTGVSGIAAQRVGEKLGSLSLHRQVLCVTHLPQIAAMADRHFHILKSEKKDETITSVATLSDKGRAEELARLHGGDVITETTLKSAEEQLLAANNFKTKHKNLQKGNSKNEGI